MTNLPHILPGDRAKIPKSTMAEHHVARFSRDDHGKVTPDPDVVLLARPITVKVKVVRPARSGMFKGEWVIEWGDKYQCRLADAMLAKQVDRQHARIGWRKEMAVAWATKNPPVAAAEGAPVCLDCARMPSDTGCFRHLKFYGIDARRAVEANTCLWHGGACGEQAGWSVQGFDLARGTTLLYVARICCQHLDEALAAACGDRPSDLLPGFGV